MRYLPLKTSLLTIGILMIPVFTYLIWNVTNTPATLSTLDSYATVGTSVKQDFQTLPTLPFTQEDTTYTMTDTTSDGIDIQFANATEPTLAEQAKPKLSLSFPKDYAEPIEVKLDNERTIKITDLGGKSDYTVDTLSQESSSPIEPNQNQSLWQRIKSLGGRTSKEDLPPTYLRYTSQDERKSLLYAFQKDQATGEKKLKHWTLYQEGTGLETEEYRIENAKVRINEGKAEVFYYGEQDLKNDQAVAEVDTNLLERAQRTLAKEMGEDLLSGTHTPDFTIPEPYYLDREGKKHEAEWKWNEEASTLSVTLTPDQSLYPIALDPTLSFTAPGVSNGGSVISGEGAGNQFGAFLTAGDFNADGKTDLAVGAPTYSSDTGRVYIFYNDGAVSPMAAGADFIISGEASSYFGSDMTTGDFNADGRTDLAVGAYSYSSYTGRTYLFYNDGSIPTTATAADVMITGQTDSFFSFSITSGDFNVDGKTDLAVGAFTYSSSTGRVYLFYGDGTNNFGTASCSGTPAACDAANADVIITGQGVSNYFGAEMTTGDFNADGRTDLAVGAYGYNPGGATNTGRTYIFYNGSIITENASGADVIITGETTSNYFSASLTSGDFNADGKDDLVVGAYRYSSFTGRAYIFYNGSIITENASGADVIITGEAVYEYFSASLISGDFNADGKTDLAIGAYGYPSFENIGRVYVFYNDGSLPTTAATADVIITGSTGSDYFGYSLASGDFNADGKTDLTVGAYYYSSGTGRVIVFYSQNGQVNTNKSITGETTSNYFGSAMTTGDFNADGRADLAVGAYGYSTNTGRVYLFYGDGQISSTAATADVTITGEASGDYFGNSLASGDLNADGKTDLIVGAYFYSTQTGRAYFFYNGAIVTEGAGSADVIITGQGTNSRLGNHLITGDFNADGKTDLVAGATHYSNGNAAGRAYLFTADGTNNFGTATCSGTPAACSASNADAIISGEADGHLFGYTLTAGDFNADGKTDLAVAAPYYSSSVGRSYLFYNGSIITENASAADVIFSTTGLHHLGIGMAAGDFNADGKTDLALGADDYDTGKGRVYIFYADGTNNFGTATCSGTPAACSADNADHIITGASNYLYLGISIVSGDFNADGRTDIAAGAHHYDAGVGRVFVFYNDGNYPASTSDADIMLTGTVGTSDEFGSLTVGDMNGDGRVDLIIGASQYSTNTGQVYIYETRENFAWEIQEQFVPTGGSGPRTGLNTSGQEMQISGEAGSYFGNMTTGDFNADGKNDLVVGAYNYSSGAGRVYVFYNDGSLTTGAINADVILTGEAGSQFGASLVVGDFNSDGKIDLVVGATTAVGLSTGRIYIFYNGSIVSENASGADITITGETESLFGTHLLAGDFNADGRTDLAVGAPYYFSNYTGRAYIFYNDGSIPTTAATADAIITGETTNTSFGSIGAAGDFNADGKTDLAVGTGANVYIFYNGSIITENASGADVIIVGANSIGRALAAGDFNADGRVDLAVSDTQSPSTAAGKVYLFYNDGSIPTTTGTADVTITESSTSQLFGSSLISGDFNADGRTDLAVGARGFSTNTGRAFIFYNDGAYPAAPSSADVILSGGEATSNYFGASLASGDFNADGKADLAVGAYGHSSNKGKVYLYTFNDPVITGDLSGGQFGESLVAADFNADGKTDLAVGGSEYFGTNKIGKVYVFYSDGTIPSTATGADAIITGEANNNYFGIALTAADFNADGKTDLVVGASGYSSGQGRIYIFYNGSIITENASGANYFITGTGGLGGALAVGDFNSDGTSDLIAAQVGGGKISVYYNDGSLPTTAAAADFISTSLATPSVFAVGDFNADGRTDFAVGDYWQPSGTYAGAVYIYYNDGTYVSPDVTIAGETADDYFGTAMVAGDFNADGRTDLAVGAEQYSSSTGRAYIFYNDGSIPITAATADVIITGEGISNHFGHALGAGDLNLDSRTDLIVGARQYNSNTGRTYIFSSGSIVTENANGADSIMKGSETYSFFGGAFATGDFNTDGKIDLAVGALLYSGSLGRVYFFTSEVASASRPVGEVLMKGTRTIKGTFRVK